MAQGHHQIVRARSMQKVPTAGPKPAVLAGLLALGCIVLAVATPMLALVAIAPSMPDLSADYLGFVWSITRFTVLQAALSTLLSVFAAIPLARALARQASFPGRNISCGCSPCPWPCRHWWSCWVSSRCGAGRAG